MQPMHLPAGATIFRTGDDSLAVYVIEDGEVVITVNDGIEVVRLHPGELFGESGVLERRPRAASATAVTAVKLLVTPAETFLHAFGMDNDRALALVKLLCRRLRSTTQRGASQTGQPSAPQAGFGFIRLLPDHPRLLADYKFAPLEISRLPFQVGNRFGGETLPIGSNHNCCISARGNNNLAAPHFEILRRDGNIGLRDLGTLKGTIVNGTPIGRASLNAFVPLTVGDNAVIAGSPDSPFRFRIQFASPR